MKLLLIILLTTLPTGIFISELAKFLCDRRSCEIPITLDLAVFFTILYMFVLVASIKKVKTE